MDAELDFASASALERSVADRMAARPGLAHVCLFAQPINRVDVTGVETFARLLALVLRQGCTLHISGLKLPIEQVLERAGVLTGGPSCACTAPIATPCKPCARCRRLPRRYTRAELTLAPSVPTTAPPLSTCATCAWIPPSPCSAVENSHRQAPRRRSTCSG